MTDKFTVTVIGNGAFSRDIHYGTSEQPYWEVSANGRLDVYKGDMNPLSTHMPGSFIAILVEPIEDLDIITNVAEDGTEITSYTTTDLRGLTG